MIYRIRNEPGHGTGSASEGYFLDAFLRRPGGALGLECGPCQNLTIVYYHSATFVAFFYGCVRSSAAGIATVGPPSLSIVGVAAG
jgi:ribosomal protein S27E